MRLCELKSSNQPSRPSSRSPKSELEATALNVCFSHNVASRALLTRLDFHHGIGGYN